jgi:hypothetical protein
MQWNLCRRHKQNLQGSYASFFKDTTSEAWKPYEPWITTIMGLDTRQVRGDGRCPSDRESRDAAGESMAKPAEIAVEGVRPDVAVIPTALSTCGAIATNMPR